MADWVYAITIAAVIFFNKKHLLAHTEIIHSAQELNSHHYPSWYFVLFVW